MDMIASFGKSRYTLFVKKNDKKKPPKKVVENTDIPDIPSPTTKKERIAFINKLFKSDALEKLLSLLTQLQTGSSSRQGIRVDELRGLKDFEIVSYSHLVNFVYGDAEFWYEKEIEATDASSGKKYTKIILNPAITGHTDNKDGSRDYHVHDGATRDKVIFRGEMQVAVSVAYSNKITHNLEHILCIGQEWALAVSEIAEVLTDRSSKKALYANRPKTYTVQFQKEKSRLFYSENKKYCGLAINQCLLVDVLRDNNLNGKDALRAMTDYASTGYSDATALAHGVKAINKNVMRDLGIKDFILNKGGYTINPVVRMK